MAKRCLVLADGFFEWRHENKKTYPYYIRLKNRLPFALAGIWDSWFNPKTQSELKSFSIITTKANSLLEKIHNTQKRMPVILRQEDERLWVQTDLSSESVQAMLRSYSSEDMEAHPVSRIVRQAGHNTTNPEVVLRQEYPDLCDL